MKEMTSRERIDAAFKKQPTDRVPVAHISSSSDVAAGLLGREAFVGFGIQQWREATALWKGPDAHAEFVERTYRDGLEVNRLMGNDLYRMQYPRQSLVPTRKIDDYTFFYEYGEEKDWKVLKYDPAQEHITVIFDFIEKPKPTFESMERSLRESEKSLDGDPREPEFSDNDLTLRAQREFGDCIAFRRSGGGVSIPRAEAWLAAVVLRPDLVARQLDLQVAEAKRSLPHQIAFGFDILFGGGDFAGYQGPFYSPKAFHELVLPRLQQVTEVVRRAGGRQLFASDGDLWSVADDLFAASGIDGYYEIDRRAGMDLRRLRETYPDLTLIGNISSHTLHVGTKEDVAEEALSCIETAKELNGIIVGVSNLPMPGTPMENIETMLQTIEDNR